MKRLLAFLLLCSIACFAGDRIDGFNCNVAVSTATTITVVTNCTGVASARYITDIEFGSSAASSTAADSFPTLKYGTGTNCGTGTTVVWSAMTAANTTAVVNLTTPIRIPASNDICWIHSGSGSKVLRVGGFFGDK